MKIKKQITKLGNMGRNRKIELAYMLLGITLLFVVTPGVIYLVGQWNGIVSGGETEYKYLNQTEMGHGGNQYGEGLFTPARVGTGIIYDEYMYDGDWIKTYNQTPNTIWQTETGDYGYTVIDRRALNDNQLLFITEIRTADLINNNRLDWYINIVADGTTNIKLVIFPTGETGYPIYGHDNQVTIKTSTGDNNTIEVGLFLPDVMTWGVSTDNGYLGLIVEGDGTNLTTGEQVKFLFAEEKPVNKDYTVDQFSAFKIASWVLGVVFLVVGVASTKYWNPTNKKDPGIVGNWIRRIIPGGKRKRKRRGKR